MEPNLRFLSENLKFGQVNEFNLENVNYTIGFISKKKSEFNHKLNDIGTNLT